MRLKCPGCGALYEVDDEAIPPEGREVMCAGCGTTWFQTRPEAAARSPGGSEVTPPVPEEPEEGPEEAPHEVPDEKAPAAVPPASHRISPETLRILREEVEIAASLRKGASVAESGGAPEPSRIEAEPGHRITEDVSAPETPAGKGPPAESAAGRGAAQAASSEEEVVIEETEAVEISRKVRRRRRGRRLIDEMAPELGDGLSETMPPVVEGVASGGSLPAEAGRAEADPVRARRAFAAIDEDEEPERRDGNPGRAGFWFGMMVVALAVAVYFLAPRISAAVPELETPLERYVTAIDAARLWLDAHVRTLSDHLWRLLGRLF